METKGAVLTRTAKVFEGMFEDKEKIGQSISVRLKYCMQRAKIPQCKLARDIGYSVDTVFKYINGKVSEEHMNIEMLKKIAIYMGMDEYYFCNEYHKFVDNTDIPKFLKETRKEMGMTQKEFASITNIPLQSYKKYEVGLVRLPEKYWRLVSEKKK